MIFQKGDIPFDLKILSKNILHIKYLKMWKYGCKINELSLRWLKKLISLLCIFMKLYVVVHVFYRIRFYNPSKLSTYFVNTESWCVCGTAL